MSDPFARVRGTLAVLTFGLAVTACSSAPNGAGTMPLAPQAGAARTVQSGGSTSGGGTSGGTTSGGGSTSSATVDTIKISKNSYAASAYELLLNASSSNSAAHLYAYAQSGAYIGEVQNGGGGQYGGTVFVVLSDPITVTITSSAGGTATSATTPFQI